MSLSLDDFFSRWQPCRSIFLVAQITRDPEVPDDDSSNSMAERNWTVAFAENGSAPAEILTGQIHTRSHLLLFSTAVMKSAGPGESETCHCAACTSMSAHLAGPGFREACPRQVSTPQDIGVPARPASPM